MDFGMLEALTCSRREDGLSCRHNVKPPLTHSLMDKSIMGKCMSEEANRILWSTCPGADSQIKISTIPVVGQLSVIIT